MLTSFSLVSLVSEILGSASEATALWRSTNLLLLFLLLLLHVCVTEGKTKLFKANKLISHNQLLTGSGSTC